MANDRKQKIMIAQFNKAIKEPNEYIKYAINENNSSVWYVLIRNMPGNKNEFEGGEYMVRVEAPEKFPFEPPHFYFITPNGVYDVEKKVCINIGEYHKDQYRAALGMSGFIEQLISGMIGWRELGGGINIVKTDDKKKSELARESREYNTRNLTTTQGDKVCDVYTKINESYNNYVLNWDVDKLSEEFKTRVGINTVNNTNQ